MKLQRSVCVFHLCRLLRGRRCFGAENRVRCVLFSLVAISLFALPAAAKVAPRRKVVPKRTAAKPKPKAVHCADCAKDAPGSDLRLSSAARGDRKDPLEKAALEFPDLKTQDDASKVTTSLQQLPGVKSAIIDVRTRLAVVDYDPGMTELSIVLATCKDAGFEANEYHVESRFPKPIKLKGG
jgi:copper chaperone CopZ